MYLNELHDKVKEIFEKSCAVTVRRKDEDKILILIQKENEEVCIVFEILRSVDSIAVKSVANQIKTSVFPCWFIEKQNELINLIAEYKEDFGIKHIKEYKPIFIDNKVERTEDTQEFKNKHTHEPVVIKDDVERQKEAERRQFEHQKLLEKMGIKPNHYKLNIKGQDVEFMDIIDAVVKDMDGRKGYIVGNILKCVCRAEKKNGLEDYKKARTYLDMLLEE